MGIFHTDISTKPVIAQVQVVQCLYCSLSQVVGIKLEKRNLVLVGGRLYGSPKPSQGMLSSFGWLLGTVSLPMI